MNSISAIKRAINHEFERQTALLQAGKNIEQETRGRDDAKKASYTLRSKEDAFDYRYFPEPDLPTLRITDAMITDATRDLIGSTYDKMKLYKDSY